MKNTLTYDEIWVTEACKRTKGFAMFEDDYPLDKEALKRAYISDPRHCIFRLSKWCLN